MNAERTTPVGAPVVIAPGTIVLVGECACVEDSPVVLAAIARHAKAQFVPRVDAMPKLVADVVQRARRELSEVFTALPLGSVLVDDEDFRHKVPLAGLGANAAVSVAAAGALLETLGLTVGSRRSQILAIAGAGHGESGEQLESGADALAAAYGGLVQVARGKDSSPRALPVVPPNGLRLVLFSAPTSVSQQRMTEGIQHYAECDPIGFENRAGSLRQLAQRFVEEIKAGQTTGAIAAARKYDSELGNLGKAAHVLVSTHTFDLAAQLAHELGGVARSTGAGDGSVGVAMFATREAAELFRKALPPQLTVLSGDLDRQGVRCQGASDEDDPNASDLVSPVSAVSGAVAPEDVPGDASAPDRREALSVGQILPILPNAGDADTARHAVTPSPSFSDPAPRRRWYRRLAMVTTGVIATVAVAWLAVPSVVSTRLRPSDPKSQSARLQHVTMPAEPMQTPPQSAPAPPPAPAEPASPSAQVADETEGISVPSPVPVSDRPRKTARAGGSMSRKRVRAPNAGARPVLPLTRAGKLSSDDF